MSKLRTELESFYPFVDEARGIMRNGRPDPTVRVESIPKPDRTRVTEYDRLIEQMLHDLVLRRHPKWGVKGEELPPLQPGAEEDIVIDPIDGTHDYIEGGNTCALAMVKRRLRVPQWAIVDAPFLGERYTAVAGEGAYLNGQRIHAGDFRFEAGVPYDFCHWDRAQPDARFLVDELHHPPFADGSIAYQIAQVAAGRSAFTVFPDIKDHDVLPGSLLATEAGAEVRKVMSLGGAHEGFVFSAPGALDGLSIALATRGWVVE